MTTITIHVRPTFRWYQEKPCKSFGFSGRAAYALGYDKPNYPVPAIVTTVQFAADMVSITEWHSEYTDTLFLT